MKKSLSILFIFILVFILFGCNDTQKTNTNNEETVKFMIWDTSGMERYSALTRSF